MDENQVNVEREDIEKFKILTKLLPIAVFTTRSDGAIDYFNEAAVQLWGRKPNLDNPEEAPYCGAWKMFDILGNLIPPEDSPMAKTLQDGKSRKNDELIIQRPDGSEANVLAHIDPFFDGDGNIKGAINVFFDLSERKKIEKDVYYLASIVEFSDDAIISKTLNGDITSWNKGAERVFGFTSVEAIGKNIKMFIPPERIDEEVRIISKISKGEKIDHFETVRLNKAGKRINVSLTVSPIKNSANQIIGASKVARNIDAQVEIQKKLKKYNLELRKLNNYKDEFISLASHELKTPLTVVKAHLELLQDSANDEIKPFITKTQVHVDKLTYLINEMLDVTKMHDNKMQLELSDFNFDMMAKSCIDSVEVVNQGCKIYYYNDDETSVVHADRQKIEQVVINLLNNAVKYSSIKKDVILKIENRENEVQVYVIDEGMGIPEHERENIFNRFYRMQGLSKHIAGLGIGLYISRQIIQQHKGEIWVEKSVVNEGTTICFTIPR